MKSKQGQIIQTQSMPLPGWYLRWVPWVVSGFACVSYLSGILTTQHLTLVSLLLLTGTYGAWLVIYHLGVQRFNVRSHPGFLLALFCLACASQFIPLPGTNYDWLLLLPIITTGLMAAIKPRYIGLLAAGALCLSSYLALRRIIPDWNDVSGQVTLPLSFLSTYGYVTIIRELAVARATMEGTNARLAAAHTRLQEYSAQVEELSTVRERNRIAREIHDTLGHALTLLSVQLETATQLEARSDPRLHEELREARQVAKACLTDVRHSVEALRPDEASAGTLQEQLRKLVAEFETTCRETRITLDLEEATHPLNPDLCLTLYRCAQEALTNIRKHAHATKVLLRLSTACGEAGRVELTVLDNGQGCEPSHEQQASGFGLRGMGERVALLDGTLRAGPQPGHGWRVEVVLPLTPRGQAEDSTTGARETREKV
ncbi:MAG TPA: sensor histidine kinase [Ktedonobacteraceae bacterium]